MAANSPNHQTDSHGSERTYNPEFWKQRYQESPYYDKSIDEESIQAAYQYGLNSQSRYSNKKFEDVQDDLKLEWDKNEDLSWESAKHAMKDAWNWIMHKDPSEPPLGT